VRDLDNLPETRSSPVPRSINLSRSATRTAGFHQCRGGHRYQLSPRALLAALLQIEARHGRNRTFKNAPRSLDLDLLLYDGLVMHEHGLTLPHPRMTERAFVLLPLAEIAPDALIPGHGRVADCLARADVSDITPLASEPAPRATRCQ
jgi:7,8-dihydro-6-hydroxymethylpterin-pyrophosphokinase